MSIVGDVLVFLDDENELSLDEIKSKLSKQTKQAISSALGRLTSKGWITTKKINNKKLFRISPNGREEITKHLNRIREKENLQWDRSWLILVFTIPEKMRRSRDVFRDYLSHLGFMKLRNELWVSFWDRRKLIEDEINHLHIGQFCSIFKIDKLSVPDQNEFIKDLQWNKKELNERYKKFIYRAEQFLNTKKDGYRARLLVYEYSQALALDPVLPDEIKPHEYLSASAYKYYQKIRPYCYK